MGAVASASRNNSDPVVEPEELKIPRHIAVIIDGNRRYGKIKYGSGTRGHIEGTKTVMKFTDWCIDAGVEALTIYAFSTENWKREKAEVEALMKMVDGFIHDILGDAVARDIRVRVLASDRSKLPDFLVESIKVVEAKTQSCTSFNLNLCVSYGARDEIVGACKKVATAVCQGDTKIDDINEDLLSKHMLTAGLPDPDIMVRTSGELRISNFLLFQIAYAELIFLDKFWPEVTRDDLNDIIVEFNRRKRRFGR
ncbi:hypothetical protein JM18_001744 [Phytophthora kernoviae]|uniref:Alkyl transferase n=2 Tax=Phytophthora kernoviae TaxID=325452 RepID=A0A922AQV4_9STRA|nr:hypothetical protein G195_001159 [Phytophthora kernoviae 00238/432]KAG2529216.1 hypothetical protein JM18_001744 [Phytophthora kernoviae]